MLWRLQRSKINSCDVIGDCNAGVKKLKQTVKNGGGQVKSVLVRRQAIKSENKTNLRPVLRHAYLREMK